MTVRGTDLSLLEQFSALKDPRQMAKVLHPLPEILLLVLAATLAGADDFVEVQAWGEERLAFLRRFLPYANGVPSHDTLNGVINALDPELFKRCFVTKEIVLFVCWSCKGWVDGLRTDQPEFVAIDGKTSRRCHARAKGREALHLVSAWALAARGWASRQRLVLGQEAVAGKSNEITAIPLLLERLELAGALVTIDERDDWSRSVSRYGARQATPSAARPGSPGRSWPRAPTISWR